MEFTKYFVCALLLVAVSSAFELGNLDDLSGDDLVRVDRHNLVACDPDEKDSKILARFYVSRKPKLLGYARATAAYPETGLGQKIITCIRATDLIGDGYGGWAVIDKGGLCMREVTLRFTSQFMRGFKFEVEIWGKDPP